MGIIDEIIPEISGAHRDPKGQAVLISDAIRSSLKELGELNKEEIIENRYTKFRKIGTFTEL